MKFHSDDFTINCEGRSAKLAGVMRLQSPNAYEEPFEPIHSEIQSPEGQYVLDISNLTFLNSSGVSALARLILLARQHNTPVSVVCSNDIPWQGKTIPSLQKLYAELEISYTS